MKLEQFESKSLEQLSEEQLKTIKGGDGIIVVIDDVG